MERETRRAFNGKLLGSLLTFGLVETLLTRDLLAADAKPLIGKWVVELSELCQSVKEHKVKDTDWQAKIEELYKRCDLPELVKLHRPRQGWSRASSCRTTERPTWASI